MSTTVRLNGASNRDNTDAVLLNDFQDKTYAASIAIVTRQNMARTTVKVGTLTGALTLTIGIGTATTDPQVGDVVRFLLQSDASIRVVTFGSGFAPAGTLSTVASKPAYIEFIFNGTVWQETGRAISA